MNSIESITFSPSRGLLTLRFEEVPGFSTEVGMFLFMNSPDHFVPMDDERCIVQRCSDESQARVLTTRFIDVLRTEPSIDLTVVPQMTVVD